MGNWFSGWRWNVPMSTKYLGKKFDIHGGGMVEIPHHECSCSI